MKYSHIEGNIGSGLVWKLSPREYHGLVETVNQNYHEELKEFLLGAFPELDFTTLCFVVVGSDGRLERHPQSKTEIVIFTRDEFPLSFKEIKERLRESNIHFEFNKKDEMDIKDIRKKDLLFSSVYGNPHLIYPDRIINATLIVGDKNLFKEVRTHVLTEVATNKRVWERLRSQFRFHRQVARTGIAQHREVFDRDKNVQFYDETPQNFRVGFKTAHLRAFQRFMLVIVGKMLRNGSKPEEIALTLPSNPIKQIIWLKEHGVLSNTSEKRDFNLELEEIIEAYKWFLREYHKIQETYKRERQPIVLKFDKEEFQQYDRILMKFFYHLGSK